LRAAGRRNAVDMAGDDDARIGIDFDLGLLADGDAGELGFLEVRDDPDIVQRHDRDHLGADIHILARADLALADQPVRRCHDPGIAEIDLGEVEHGALGLGIGAKLRLLGVEHAHLPALAFEGGAVALQRGLEAPLVGGRLLDLLRRAVAGREQGVLTLGFQFRALHIGLGHGDGAFRLGDTRLLEKLARLQILDRRVRAEHVRFGLRDMGLILVIVDLHQQVAFLHRLEVLDRDLADIAIDLGADRRDIAAHIGVVGGLPHAGADPAVPSGDDEGGNRRRDQQDGDADRQPDPRPALRRSSRSGGGRFDIGRGKRLQHGRHAYFGVSKVAMQIAQPDDAKLTARKPAPARVIASDMWDGGQLVSRCTATRSAKPRKAA